MSPATPNELLLGHDHYFGQQEKSGLRFACSAPSRLRRCLDTTSLFFDISVLPILEDFHISENTVQRTLMAIEASLPVALTAAYSITTRYRPSLMLVPLPA
jgi:hypothetical protein